MEKFKCKNCGASDFVRKDDKYVCQYCGTEYPIPEEELEKEKQNKAEESPRNTSSKFQNIPVSSSSEKTGYVDASSKKPAKKKLSRGSQIAIIVIIVIAVVSIISMLNSSDLEEEADNTIAMVETEMIKATEQSKAPATEKETNAHKIEVTPVDDFDYELAVNEIILKSYEGESDFLEIASSYTVYDNEYNTNLTDCNLGYNDFVTVIFDEGITELKDTIFNSVDAENIYFPTTLTYIDDKTLSYLDPEEGEKVQIYYGGTEEQWDSIFTIYERTKVSDAEFGAEMGTAIADALNELIDAGYDDSEFEYHFDASPDDLKR